MKFKDLHGSKELLEVQLERRNKQAAQEGESKAAARRAWASWDHKAERCRHEPTHHSLKIEVWALSQQMIKISISFPVKASLSTSNKTIPITESFTRSTFQQPL